MEKRSNKRECPFCFREIENSEAAFLLKTEGYRFQSPVLNEMIAPKLDTLFRDFWSTMGLPEEQIDARRIVIDNHDISQLNQELLASGKETAVKKLEEDTNGYSFHLQEGAMNVFSNTMICPHCHNALPQNFFKYDMLKIGLAGSVASGKTVYLSSLLMNSFQTMQRENLTVRNAGVLWDKETMEMEESADRLYYFGICPEATSKVFRKPYFFELTYQLDGRHIPMLIAIYDVAGELMRETLGSGRTSFVRHVDGYICLVDPAQMQLEHAVVTNEMPDEARVLSKLHVMSKEEQIAIQRMSNENGKQVMDFHDFMVTEGPSENFLMERKAESVLNNIRGVLGSAELKQKYMALVLTKSDLLESLGEINAFTGSSLLFEREQVSYGFYNTDHHFLRQGVLSQIFDQKVYRLQKNLNDYKNSSLFAVSALGCDTEMVENDEGTKIEKTVGKVNPIRVEEPVFWMVMKYMQERRWLD